MNTPLNPFASGKPFHVSDCGTPIRPGKCPPLGMSIQMKKKKYGNVDPQLSTELRCSNKILSASKETGAHKLVSYSNPLNSFEQWGGGPNGFGCAPENKF